MRVGILTYHAVNNFGANLQAYSTIGFLRKAGFEPFIINWVPEDLEAGYKKGSHSVQAHAHREFIESLLPITSLCRGPEDVAQVIEELDIEAVIIGSDAVLQHKNFLSRVKLTSRGIKIKEKRTNLIFPSPFWGSFIPLLKKSVSVIVMSASSQNMNFHIIRGPLKKKIGKALKNFRYITVRDEWTAEMVQYFTKGSVNPPVTPDPVFGYNSNIDNQISKEELSKKFGIQGEYVLFSFKNSLVLPENWLLRCEQLLKEQGLYGVIMTMPNGVVFKQTPMKVIAPPLRPDEWYALIKYSSGYVGENMHPIVVALHNVVPFYSFDAYGILKMKYFVNEKSSKIYHILEKADFLDNRISTLGRGYVCPEPETVVGKIVNFDREKCRDFSLRQQKTYEEMMKKITSLIKK